MKISFKNVDVTLLGSHTLRASFSKCFKMTLHFLRAWLMSRKEPHNEAEWWISTASHLPEKFQCSLIFRLHISVRCIMEIRLICLIILLSLCTAEAFDLCSYMKTCEEKQSVACRLAKIQMSILKCHKKKKREKKNHSKFRGELYEIISVFAKHRALTVMK